MLMSRNILFLLIFVVGGTLLQIFLSKRKNKWFGLILPFICLLFSLIAILGIGTSIFQMVAASLLYNIPTVILLIIYFASRENIRKNSQLEKMNIQDLN